MTEWQLRERVDSFPVWHYEFDLGHGVRTPIRKQRDINRVLQRKAYAFDSFVGLLGGSLQGKRVLDLGCNAGYWSLAAMEAGADFVLGVDGRQIATTAPDKQEKVYFVLNKPPGFLTTTKDDRGRNCPQRHRYRHHPHRQASRNGPRIRGGLPPILRR